MTIIPLVIFTIIAFSFQKKTQKIWSPATVRILKNILLLLMVATVVVLVTNAFRYLLTPAFFEYGEENIASVAAYWLHGHPIYHSLSSADRYSLLYGPLPTLIIAFFQKFGGDVFVASKLPGVLCLFATLLLLGALVIRHDDWPVTKKLILLATFSAILIDFYNASFWDRPDSFILALTVLGLLLADVDGPRFLLAVTFGFCAGCLANCKAYSLLAVIPSFVFYLERKKPANTKSLALAFCLTAIATGFAFFLVPGVSMANFISILLLATHELNFVILFNNIVFLLPFFALLLLSNFQSDCRATFYSLIATLLITAVIACKTGGGLYYFMPYLPLLFYFAAVSDETLAPQRRAHLRRFAVCVFLGFFWLVPQYEGRMLRFFNGRGQQAISNLHDLQILERKYPGPKSIGVTDAGTNYRDYYVFYFSPELIIHGGRLLIDFPAIMEFHLAHIKIPQATYKALASCEVRDFILPSAGMPWTAGSIYHHQTPIFTKKFRDIFAKHYKRIDAIGPFALYRCSAG